MANKPTNTDAKTAQNASAPKVKAEKLAVKQSADKPDVISGGEGLDAQKGSIQDTKTDMLKTADAGEIRNLNLSKFIRGDDKNIAVKLKFNNGDLVDRFKLQGNSDNLFVIYDKDKISLAGSAEEVKALLSQIRFDASGYKDDFRIEMRVSNGENNYTEKLFVRFDDNITQKRIGFIEIGFERASYIGVDFYDASISSELSTSDTDFIDLTFEPILPVLTLQVSTQSVDVRAILKAPTEVVKTPETTPSIPVSQPSKPSETLVNTAPIVANALLDQTATEDAVFSYQFASNSFTDPDVGVTLTYSATLADGSPLPSWLSFDSNTRTFSGTPTNSDVGTITVRVTTSDGTATVTDDFTITTANVNDAAVLSDVGGSIAYQQNATEEVIDSSITITDVDDTHIESAVVSITGNFNSGDLLNFTSQNGITGSYDTGTGILTLTGSATKAQYEAALESITFSSNSAIIGNRNISFTVNDGDANSNTQTATINYTLAPQAVINLSSLNGTNGFRLDGVAASDSTGFSVSSAGDVNGDGFDDVIVGGWRADHSVSNSGSSYVVFGSAAGFTSSISLSSLNGSNGFRLDGVGVNDYAGIFVSNAGDVNGDGIDDLIIGAHYADPNGISSGSSYVVFGSGSGFTSSINLSTLNGTNGFRLDGVAAGDFSGRSVSSAGDVNGDGFDDIIVGALWADPNGSNSGSSYVVFGSGSGFASSINLSALDGTNGFRLDGVAAGDWSGLSLSNAGDVNGDGFDDIIVGARYSDANIANSGSSYVVFGSGSGFTSSLNLSALNGINGFRLDGVTANDQSGFSVSSAGDVNGDGFDDIIVGALLADPNGSNSGSSYVVFGSGSGFTSSINLSTLDGTNGFRLDGVAADDLSGSTVSSAGDVNGDGFNDIIIGARGADPNGLVSSGSSYVVFGSDSGFTSSINLSTLDGTNGFRLDGVAVSDWSGYSVSSAGDVNGDGFDDLIVGRLQWNGGEGSSYVIFGNNDSGAVSHVGTSGNDTLTGTGSADAMIGGLGNDSIIGGADNDVIKGANGNDTIIGGTGADRLWGGSGNDVFVYTNTSDSGTTFGNYDRIYDFETGVDDIDLSQFSGIATLQAGGNGLADLNGSVFQVAFERIGGNTMVYVDSDGDNNVNFQIELLGVTNLTASDFVL